jgi:hypothetical protein
MPSQPDIDQTAVRDLFVTSPEIPKKMGHIWVSRMRLFRLISRLLMPCAQPMASSPVCVHAANPSRPAAIAARCVACSAWERGGHDPRHAAP